MSATSGVVGSLGSSHPLDKLFCPRSIAVLGVTKTPGTVPYDCFWNILHSGYTGTLYPVAPGKKSICAVPAYRYVVDIPDEIDLAVIILPANVVDRALEQCGQKGIKSVITISAGFREVGEEGLKREIRLKELIKQYGINLIGPNCFGMINADPAVAMNASFSRKMPSHGRIGFLSQSGGMCAAALDYALEHDIGFTKFVSFGNKAGISEVDLLNYLHQDSQTHVIMMYLEELGVNGRLLIEAARKITRGPNPKPIVAIKSGRTPRGAQAATSHTGSRPSDDAIVDAVFRDAGIIRAGSFQELFDLATMLAYQPLPKGNRLAVITNTGGPGVLCTDAAMNDGQLVMSQFEPETTKQLRDTIPSNGSVKNPVDVLGDGRSERYGKCLELTLKDPNVDQAIVILTPHSMTDVDGIAQACYDVAKKAGKPVATSFMGGADVASAIKLLLKLNMPHFLMPEYAARAMGDIQRILQWRTQDEGSAAHITVDQAAAKKAVAGKSGKLDEASTKALLKAYGLSSDAAAKADGQQIVLGGKQEATFGPTIYFAVGRLLMDVFKDVSFALAPITPATAGRMIHRLKAASLLEGKAVVAKIEDQLVRLAQLVADLPQLAEIELTMSATPEGLALCESQIQVK